MDHTPSDSLDEYFQHSYREERLEFERVRKILNDVWPVFQHTHTDEGWPYELEEGSTDPTPKKYSFSTNAMILFAMAFGLGWIRRGPMATIVPKPIDPKDIDQQKKTFVAGIRQLIKKSGKGGEPIFSSNSFGTNDPLTLSWVLDLLANSSAFEKDLEKPTFTAFKTRVTATAQKRVRAAFEDPSESCLEWGKPGMTALDHAFPLLLAVHAYVSLSILDPGKDTDTLAALARTKVRPFLLNRLHLHLSLASVPNSNFDAAELVFALEGLLLIDSHPRAVESALLKRCFSVMEETQQRSPYWRPLKPFVTTQTGLALLPLSVEIANSLLRICRHLEADDGDCYFTAHNSLFTRYSSWLFTRVARIRKSAIPSGYLIGWHSEHVHAPRKIHPWETAQVLIFFLKYSELLQGHIALTSLTKANFSITRPARKSGDNMTAEEYWLKNWEQNEPLRGLLSASTYRIYTEIRKKFIETRAEDRPKDSGSGYFSMLLFGPPGTGKTTIAEELAKALKWRLITITPSDFIARGEAEVEARAKSIFRALEEQDKLVILFDEIDRMILDRDCILYREQGDTFQFMTPSMLVKVKNLREAKRSIFIIATNYAERIDPAIKRIGRIDEKFLVSPADKAQRLEIIRKLFSDNVGELEKVRGGGSLRDRFLKNIGTEPFADIVSKSVFASYGELKNLVKEAVAIIDKSKWPNMTELNSALTAAYERLGAPSISLSNYKSRFNPEKSQNFPTVQKPFREFLVLCHLAIENGTFADDKLLKEVLVEAGVKNEDLRNVTAIRDCLMALLRDATLSDKITNHLTK